MEKKEYWSTVGRLRNLQTRFDKLEKALSYLQYGLTIAGYKITNEEKQAIKTLKNGIFVPGTGLIPKENRNINNNTLKANEKVNSSEEKLIRVK